MPIDRTRLESSTQELASAQGAYDAALREFTAATRRLAVAPGDAQAIARAQAASATLDQMRSRLDSARRQWDVVRADELVDFTTWDQVLGATGGDQVLALFPVGVEAKLDAGQRLRVRVWPDAIHTATHDPRLTPEELAAGQQYWRAEAAASAEDLRRAAWRVLADGMGATRAAWIAHVLTPTNRPALAPGVEPVFPDVPMLDDKAPFVPRPAILPDRWLVVAFRDGVRAVEHLGAPIPTDLAVGLDTTPAETAALANREGQPIQLPPRMRWLTDFAVAKEVGMAMEIPLAAGVDRLDLLLVLGIRVTQSPTQSAEALAGLFTGHRFSRGLAFVPQDTPTNNSAAGGSGLPPRSERVERGFDLERQNRAFPQGLDANGVITARAFGLDPAVIAAMADAGASVSVPAEPDGFESERARAMQTVVWQVTLGAALEDFVGLSAARVDALRSHFCQHVRGAGPIPAVRVGRQPYGVLPVTSLSAFVATPADGLDSRLLQILKAGRSWWAMQRQGELFAGSSEDALRFLGRSVRLFAETSAQNPSVAGANRWSTLARSLAVTTRNLIPPDWLTSPMRATVDGQPRPVTRVMIDDATAGELATLATALPTAIQSAPLPSSLVARIARHATLLEWGRFARGVCEAALDAASRRSLSVSAAQAGIQIYLPVVVHAMTARPGPGRVDPLPPVVVRAAAARDPIEPRDPPEPADPVRPPIEPVPRPPRDTPEMIRVDEAEQQRIRTLVGSLAQPLASCPGAPRLESFRRALLFLSQLPAAHVEAELYRALDLSNHRLDAWITSLAAQRLTTLRTATPRGVVIGGWGCLQDVRPRNAQDPLQRAEFIHTPTLDHAAAAAVLRSGARKARSAGSHHADIDLSSRRVRLARWILDGVRDGRSLGELLGVRFERAIKGTPGETRLQSLRAQFGAKSATSIVDGLQLHQRGLPATSDASLLTAAKGMEAALDAVTDALTAEAVFQIVKGNPAGALIDVQAIASGQSPPQLRVTETPPAGTRLTHRVAIVLPAGAAAPGWSSFDTPRKRADPLTDAWCGHVLGRPDVISLTVEDAHGVVVPIALSALALAAIDVVLEGRDHGVLLRERVLLAARRAHPQLADAEVREERAWQDLVALCGAAAQLLARAQPLRGEALELPGALVEAPDDGPSDVAARLAAAEAAFGAARDALAAGTDTANVVGSAAALGVRVPGALLEDTPGSSTLDALLSAVNVRLAAAAAATTPRERLRALFGGELPVLSAFLPRDQMALTTAGAEVAPMLGGDSQAPHAWLDAVARCRPASALLTDVLQRVEIIRGVATPLRIAQAPWQQGDRWIATAFTGAAAGTRPEGRLSIVMHAPAGFDASTPVGGLLVDAWTEIVPADTHDTAIALRYNSPNTRAPQSVLLAVSPDPSRPWTTETLVTIVRETLELARTRMQAPTTFSRSGLMPLVWLGQRPGGAGISFEV